MGKFVVMILLLAGMGQAESRFGKWTRRALTAAACAASAVDGYNSAMKVDGARFTESNPLLRNANGSVNIGRMVGLKVGMCAAPIILGEFGRGETMKRSATFDAGGSLAIFTWIDIHNHAVFNAARQE